MTAIANTSTAIRPIDQLRSDLESKRETLLATLPSHLNDARFLESAARCCIDNPGLLDCTRVSLFMSIAEAASMGLELGESLGLAYLVPFKNRGVSEATLVPGWKGIKELAYRSEKLAVFDWCVVRPNDEFDFEKGTEQFLKHKPASGQSEDWTHVWAMGETVYGGKRFEVMTRSEVESHRNKFSKGWKRQGSAWLSNPEAMALKTVALRCLRLLPMSAEAQRLVERATYAESPASFDQGETPEDSIVPAEDLDQLADKIGGDKRPTESQYSESNEPPADAFAGDEPSPSEQEAIRQREFTESQ